MYHGSNTQAILDYPLFKNLDPATAEELISLGFTRSYECSTEIVAQGGTCHGMYLVLEGHVGISVVDHAGHHANLVRAGVGNVLCDLEALTGKPCLATCTTEPNATLFFWPTSNLQRFLEEPELARNVIALSYQRLSVVNKLHSLDLSCSVSMRIAHRLDHMSVHSPLITHSQSYIAEAVGCSRQTVNRVLGQLREAGIIKLRKSKIEVCDKERLLVFFAKKSD